MEIDKILKETEFFRYINESARKEIKSNTTIITANQNDYLFIEGDKGTKFYILAEGSVKLFKGTPDGREITIRLVKPNEMFAETILFERDSYPVNAIAVTDSTLLAVQRSAFHKLLEQSGFRNEFIIILLKRMRYLADRILYLTSHDVEERFFKFILDRYGVKDTYDINLPKKDIASAIGTIPETLSRLLLRLKNSGLISWEGNVLKIKDDYIENFNYD